MSLLFAVAVPRASAALVIGNLPQMNDGLDSNLTSGSRKAIVFTTGSTEYTVDNVILRLSNYNSTVDNALVSFFLDDGSGNGTGAAVSSSLAQPSGNNVTGNYTFLPTGVLTLAPNTKHWLVVGVGPNGAFDWEANNPGIPPTGGPGVVFDSARFSTNNGSSYSITTTLNSFEINGTAVPELSSLILVGAAGSLLSVATWFRSRKGVRKAV